MHNCVCEWFLLVYHSYEHQGCFLQTEVSNQVLRKPGCTATRDALRGIKLFSENIGADQLICAFVFAYTKRCSPNDNYCIFTKCMFLSAIYSKTVGFLVRPEDFYFSFHRPSRPDFLKIEKKIKDIFFNFIFVFPSDSCQYSPGVQLCFSF